MQIAAFEAELDRNTEAASDFSKAFQQDPGLRSSFKKFIEGRHLQVRP